eukprot:Clim_evm19s204 gene=Clim_evmTU19s204
MDGKPVHYDFDVAIIGGGVAGTTAAEVLSALDAQDGAGRRIKIGLVSATSQMKVANVRQRLTERLADVSVSVVYSNDLGGGGGSWGHAEIVLGRVMAVDSKGRKLICEPQGHDNGNRPHGTFIVTYRRLLIASGATPVVPNIIRNIVRSDSEESKFVRERVITVRDTESIGRLTQRLLSENTDTVAVIGNGGIALELIQLLKGAISVLWLIRSDSDSEQNASVGASYLDEGAARFFVRDLAEVCMHSDSVHVGNRSQSTRNSHDENDFADDNSANKKPRTLTNDGSFGPALGPGWSNQLRDKLKDRVHTKGSQKPFLCLCPGMEIEGVMRDTGAGNNVRCLRPAKDQGTSDHQHALTITLTDGTAYSCDLVVAATGVEPCVGFLSNPSCTIHVDSGSPDPEQIGVAVDHRCRSISEYTVYAAGDCCSVRRKQGIADGKIGPLWFQMRLWSQARAMGHLAARHIYESLCRSGDSSDDDEDDDLLDMTFDLFTHVTEFFGKKVVLLGLYRGQGLEKNHYEVLLRISGNEEYIKVIVGNDDGKVKGVTLIGDTDLEETFENLILNGTNISHLKEGLLDPDVDLEDYFD